MGTHQGVLFTSFLEVVHSRENELMQATAYMYWWARVIYYPCPQTHTVVCECTHFQVYTPLPKAVWKTPFGFSSLFPLLVAIEITEVTEIPACEHIGWKKTCGIFPYEAWSILASAGYKKNVNSVLVRMLICITNTSSAWRISRHTYKQDKCDWKAI